MKKSVINFATLAIIASSFMTAIVSCDDDDDPKVPVIPPVTTPVKGIEMNMESLSIIKGDESTDVLSVKILPEEASVDTIIWTVTPDSIAYISDQGVISPLKTGYAKVYVKTKDSKFIDSCRLYVTEEFVPVTKLDVVQQELNVRMNQERTLSYKLIDPENATTAQNIKWFSGNEGIATVDPTSGKITPVAIGTTKVYATNADKTVGDSCLVNIIKSEIDVTEVAIEKKWLAVPEGTADTLKAMTLPDSATLHGVRWYSDNESIIKIDSLTGFYSAVKEGKATITAVSLYDNSIVGKCPVYIYTDNYCFIRINNKEELFFFPGEIETILDNYYIDGIEFTKGQVYGSDLAKIKEKLSAQLLLLDLKDIDITKGPDKTPDFEIPADYFKAFTNIRKIVLPNETTVIPDNTFAGLKSLNSVVMSDSVRTIGKNAFSGTMSLTDIKLPENLETIGDFCFFEGGLKMIEIPDKVTTIGRHALGRCFQMDSIIIGKGLNITINNPMYECSALKKIRVSEENQNLKVINNALYSFDATQLYCIPSQNKSYTVTLEETLANITAGAINGAQMVKIIIPNTIKSIRSITNCKKLEVIELRATEPPVISDNFLNACDSLKQIIVPDADTYKNSAAWSKYADKIITAPEDVE